MKILDLTSKQFGNLTVLSLSSERSSDGSRIWICKCACGNIGKYPANKLNFGKCVQCYDCGRKNKINAGHIQIDIKGHRSGRLVAMERTEDKHSDGSSLWLCFCDCGSKIKLTSCQFKSKERVSCGCYRSEMAAQRQTTHGMSGSITYSSWISMRERVTNENSLHFDRYGGRGITICDRWLNSFEAFYSDMGSRPSLEYSIDRINNDGNYEPGNCKWSTDIEQARNRSNTIKLTYNGIEQSIDTWVDQLNLSKPAVLYRLNSGWSHVEALFGRI